MPQCPVCSRTFSTLRGQSLHIRYAHPDYIEPNNANSTVVTTPIPSREGLQATKQVMKDALEIKVLGQALAGNPPSASAESGAQGQTLNQVTEVMKLVNEIVEKRDIDKERLREDILANLPTDGGGGYEEMLIQTIGPIIAQSIQQQKQAAPTTPDPGHVKPEEKASDVLGKIAKIPLPLITKTTVKPFLGKLGVDEKLFKEAMIKLNKVNSVLE